MIGIIKNLELKWPYYLMPFFNIAMNLGFLSTTEIINIDCLISNSKIELAAFYIKAQLTLYFYIIFVSVAASFYSIRHFIFKKRNQFQHFIMFFLVFSIMIQPSSIQIGTNFFVCQKIGEKSYMIYQISEECYTENHIGWVKNKKNYNFI